MRPRLAVFSVWATLAALAGPAAAAPPQVTILILGPDLREPAPADDHPRPTVARRRIRIDARGASGPRARLYAALAADGPGRTLRVDGLVLTTTPQLISAATPLGAPEGHTLEIETSRDGATSVPETIVWTAEIR